MNYKSSLEALLFAFGDDGIALLEVQKMFEMDDVSFEAFIIGFQEAFQSEDHGIECVKYGDRIKFITKSQHHALITSFLDITNERQLSQAALETLAIIAYKQPITRIEIEEVRGVNSDMMCRRLEAMDLIREVGRADTVGRPILYEVTPSFMDVFKLTSLKELPEIKLEETEEENGLFKRD